MVSPEPVEAEDCDVPICVAAAKAVGGAIPQFKWVCFEVGGLVVTCEVVKETELSIAPEVATAIIALHTALWLSVFWAHVGSATGGVVMEISGDTTEHQLFNVSITMP
jgi:hypothetical protein